MYVAVLGTSMLVTVIGVSAIMVSRINLRATSQGNDWVEAGTLAFSAVEHGLAVIKATPDWRTTFLHGARSTDWPFGPGTFAWKLEDQVDKDLANNDTDPVRLYGIGQVGQATRRYSVLLQPGGGALTCLEVALCTGGILYLDDATANCNQIISSNDSVNGVHPRSTATSKRMAQLRESPSAEALQHPSPGAPCPIRTPCTITIKT